MGAAPRDGESASEVDYVLVMREGEGETRVVREMHQEGVFSLTEWMEALAEVGFAGSVLENDGRCCLVGEKE